MKDAEALLARPPLEKKSPNTATKNSEPQPEDNRKNDTFPLTKAFSCCLREYGVKVDGQWQRRFRLFGTNIKA